MSGTTTIITIVIALCFITLFAYIGLRMLETIMSAFKGVESFVQPFIDLFNFFFGWTYKWMLPDKDKFTNKAYSKKKNNL
jgi:hypothetical protein